MMQKSNHKLIIFKAKTSTNMDNQFLSLSIKLFNYYKELGEKAMKQIAAEKLFISPNIESNSIAIIVQHLHGNMLSRWTDFLTTDGEKPNRNRDSEFEHLLKTPEELLISWEAGWKVLLDTLEGLTESDMTQIVYIRNEGHSVAEAITRQIAHYAYHVGQIVFIAKMYSSDDWQSLSIPRNKSVDYNNQKFQEDKKDGFFTDKV